MAQNFYCLVIYLIDMLKNNCANMLNKILINLSLIISFYSVSNNIFKKLTFYNNIKS